MDKSKIENRYVGRPTADLIESALEMANEIRVERERFYALATTISEHLTPRNNEDSPDCISLRLAEVLEEMLVDTGQQNRLIKCLEAIQAPLAAQPSS